MYLPAWYHRAKCGATGDVSVKWDQHTVLSSGPPPTSEVIVEAFAAGEPFPADGPLVRQANGDVNSVVNNLVISGFLDIEIPAPLVVHPPAGTGTWTIWQAFQATSGLNMALINAAGVKNTSVSTYTIVLPQPFSSWVFAISTSIHNVTFLKSGVSENANEVQALQAGSTVSVGSLDANSWADIQSGITGFQLAGSDGTTRTGSLILIGI